MNSAGGCRGIAYDGSRREPAARALLSVQVPKEYPGGIFPVWKGLYFDSASWDGSDIFMPEGRNRWTLVVSEVKRAFDVAHVKNALFTPLPEVEQSE